MYISSTFCDCWPDRTAWPEQMAGLDAGLRSCARLVYSRHVTSLFHCSCVTLRPCWSEPEYIHPSVLWKPSVFACCLLAYFFDK